MASPAWLPQEVKPSVSQSPVSVSPAGGTSTQTSASLASSVGPHTSNSSGGSTTDSIQEPLQANFSNAPSFAVPTPSFSYGVPPNANISFGASQQSSPGSVSINLLMLCCILYGRSYDLWLYFDVFSNLGNSVKSACISKGSAPSSWLVFFCHSLFFIQHSKIWIFFP